MCKSPKTANRSTGEETINFRYGPMPNLEIHHPWSRAVLLMGVLVYIWCMSESGRKEVILAKREEIVPLRGQPVSCDPKYLKDISQFPGCAPLKCGRFVSDTLVTATEFNSLLNVARSGINLAGSAGGASILDLHSGALSFGDKFINVYSLETAKTLIADSDLKVYNIVKNKVQQAIADNFHINSDDLYLTHPTFFSKFTNTEAKTIHDEYWHIHVDKETYESFHYTSLLYLSDFKVDFDGGRFIFVDNIDNPNKNITVEPKKGRVLMFTSGSENPHFVEKVTSGTRYALTISFTCDQKKAIEAPGMHH